MHAGEIQDRGVWERDSILVSRASVSFSQEVAVPGIILSFFFFISTGLPRLTNKKRGDYYGRAQTWPQSKRREMGVFLLKRALKILLNEGERQLRPGDLRVTQTS